MSSQRSRRSYGIVRVEDIKRSCKIYLSKKHLVQMTSQGVCVCVNKVLKKHVSILHKLLQNKEVQVQKIGWVGSET